MATVSRISKKHFKSKSSIQRKSKFQKKIFNQAGSINGIVATEEDARIIIKALNTVSPPSEALDEVFVRFRGIERH